MKTWTVRWSPVPWYCVSHFCVDWWRSEAGRFWHIGPIVVAIRDHRERCEGRDRG